tara:strand:- start:2274 stop:2507 length:234 start_codon:yes stop_codon:yes gene_type:complete
LGEFFVSQIGNKLLHSVIARALKHNTHQYYNERKERIVGEDEQSVVFVVVVEKKKNNENKCPMQSKRLSKTKLGRHL